MNKWSCIRMPFGLRWGRVPGFFMIWIGWWAFSWGTLDARTAAVHRRERRYKRERRQDRRTREMEARRYRRSQ